MGAPPSRGGLLTGPRRTGAAGGAVVVACEQAAKPIAVRYAWAPEPTSANLYNRDGFPALPFESP